MILKEVDNVIGGGSTRICMRGKWKELGDVQDLRCI